jgi:hypothetical protein
MITWTRLGYDVVLSCYEEGNKPPVSTKCWIFRVYSSDY